MSDFHLDCTDYTFETQGELAVELAFDFAVDLVFDLSPYSPADTQRCRVETAALSV
jgi:hypothetical protein